MTRGSGRHSTSAPHWQANLIELKGRQYSLGIEWDDLGAEVDLDLQAVIVNRNGIIVDAVYYNNLEALGGAIGSQGDATDGHEVISGLDEVVWVSLSKVPKDIVLIIFVVAAYNERSLKEAHNGKVVLMETVHGLRQRIAQFKVEKSVADVDVVGMIRRTKEDSWLFVEVDLSAEHGSHFLDILEPTMGDIIRHEIPHAPQRQNVKFQMVKGAVVHFQGLHALKRVAISLDADVADDATEAVDIDITAVFYSEDNHCLGAVDSVNEEMFGVGHSGAMHYEHHEHIQESLSIDLMQIPENVKHIFIVLTIQHGSFQGIRNVHMHIADQDSQDLATLDVPAGHKETALVVARVFNASSRLTKRWALQSHGIFFGNQGTTWHTEQCKKELLHLLHESAGDHHQHHYEHKHTLKSNSSFQSNPPKKKKIRKKGCGAVIARPKSSHSLQELPPDMSTPPLASQTPGEKPAPMIPTPSENKTGVLRKKGGLRAQAKVSECLAKVEVGDSKISPTDAIEVGGSKISPTDAIEVGDPKISPIDAIKVNDSKMSPADPISGTCEIVPIACNDETEPQKLDACSACIWSQHWWCRS